MTTVMTYTELCVILEVRRMKFLKIQKSQLVKWSPDPIYQLITYSRSFLLVFDRLFSF